MHRQIDDIIETLKTAKQRGVSTVVLTGAGCSVSAGIPTAAGFVDLIKERYPRSYERAPVKQYPHCMAQLSVNERRDLIVAYIEKAKINWAHVGLAQLIARGFIDRVLTTNFDPLVMRACAMVDIFPAIYDFAASQHFKPADIAGHSIFHLHGQHTGFVLLNTEEECTRHAAHLAPVFEDAGRRRVWLVVGYSGESDPVFEHLARVERFDNKLYWIGYKDHEPPRHVRERILSGSKDAYYVNGFDADEFFVTLAQRLECFPPDFIARPFSHLDKRMQQLAPFRLPNQVVSNNIVHIAHQVIRQAKDLFEERPATTGPVDRNIVEAADAPLVLKAMGHLIAGQYDQVIAMRPRKGQQFPQGLRAPISLSFCAKGNLSLAAASGLRGEAMEKSIGEAIDYYQKATEVSNQLAAGYQAWGRALTARALSRRGRSAAKDLDNAVKKYEEALTKTEDKQGIYHDILNSLLAYLNVESENAEPILARMEGCLQRAQADSPDLPVLRIYSAGLWLERGKRRTDAEGKELLQKAYEEYVTSANNGPYIGAMWHNAGNALAELARRSSEVEGTSLFERALEHYQRSALPPEQAAVTANAMGALYFVWAQQSTGELQQQRCEQSVQYLSSALDAQPDFLQALINLMGLQRLRAPRLSRQDAAALWQEVLQRIDAAALHKADALTVDMLRGDALADRAQWLPAPEDEMLRMQAMEIYTKIAGQHPDRPRVAEALGGMFLRRASQSSGAESDSALRKAVEWYTREHKLRPQEPALAQAFAAALYRLSRRVERKEQERLLHQAVVTLRPLANDTSAPAMLMLMTKLLASLANLKPKKSALSLLKEAEPHVKAAAACHPDFAKPRIEWALLLTQQAEHADDREAQALFEQAVAKIREVLVSTPDDTMGHATLGAVILWRERKGATVDSQQRLQEAIREFEQAPENQAIISAQLMEAYHRLARLTPQFSALVLWEQAVHHATRAAEIEPTSPFHAENLGAILMGYAELLADDQRLPLLKKASNQYALACAINPPTLSAQLGRARSLTELSTLAPDADDEALWPQAQALFAAIEQSHPDDLSVLGAWGQSLLQRAEVLQTERAWEAAAEVFRRAATRPVSTGSKLTWPYFGIAAALAGQAALTADGVQACRLAGQAKTEVLTALKSEPENSDGLSILASVTLQLAYHAGLPIKKELLLETSTHLSAVVVMATATYRLLNYWGQLLMQLGMVADADERDQFFAQAIVKFEQAVQGSKHRHLELLNQATAWLTWAISGQPADAAMRLARVEQVLNDSYAISPTLAVRVMRTELRALRAVLATTEVNEGELQASICELDALLATESSNAMVHVSAARLYQVLARHMTESSIQELFLQIAAQYWVKAEQLAPGCTRGRNGATLMEAPEEGRVESAVMPLPLGPSDIRDLDSA